MVLPYPTPLHQRIVVCFLAGVRVPEGFRGRQPQKGRDQARGLARLERRGASRVLQGRRPEAFKDEGAGGGPGCDSLNCVEQPSHEA